MKMSGDGGLAEVFPSQPSGWNIVVILEKDLTGVD